MEDDAIVIKNLQEKLKKCEENFNLFTENMEDIIWRTDSSFHFTYVSPADKKARGFEPEEVLGKTVFEIMTIDSIKEIKEKHTERIKLLEQGVKLGSTTYELELIRKDGTTFWADILSNPIYDQNGIIIGYQGITRNIQQRKNIEQQIKEQDQLFKTAVNNAPVVIFQIDSDGIFQLSEGMGLKKLGLKPGQVVGLSAFDVYKDFPEICRQVRDALNGKIIKEIIFINNLFFEIIYNPIKDKRGRITCLIGIAIDITENYKMQNELRESEEKFRSLFENMAEGVALHEIFFDENQQPVNYRIMEVNPSYRKHTGLNETDVNGLLATDLYGTDYPPYLKEFSEVAISGKPYHYETYFHPLERFFNISVISPGKNKFATVFEDITSQKNRERELKEKNEELERFTYTVSHDLKSPLVTIKGFIGMLEQDILEGDSEIVKDDIERIKSAADKMADLLNDLLELSRIGRIINPPVKIKMYDVIKDTIGLLNGIINQSNTTIIVDENMPYVKVDKKRFNEVWQNLIENAIKFMAQQDDKKIEIGYIKDINENIFYIKDNGIGIESEYFNTIFGLFNKLDNKSEGTGIGLSLVKRIIEVHSGHIWVESEGLGRGATFKFALPAVK